MIDKLIIQLATEISKHCKPSTVLKCGLLALGISIIVSPIFGQWLIIAILSINMAIWFVTEFAYSKSVEDAVSEESSSENESDPETVAPDA